MSTITRLPLWTPMAAPPAIEVDRPDDFDASSPSSQWFALGADIADGFVAGLQGFDRYGRQNPVDKMLWDAVWDAIENPRRPTWHSRLTHWLRR